MSSRNKSSNAHTHTHTNVIMIQDTLIMASFFQTINFLHFHRVCLLLSRFWLSFSMWLFYCWLVLIWNRFECWWRHTTKEGKEKNRKFHNENVIVLNFNCTIYSVVSTHTAHPRHTLTQTTGLLLKLESYRLLREFSKKRQNYKQISPDLSQNNDSTLILSSSSIK